MDGGWWGIAAPQAHGPDGCSLSATRLNVSASGQHEASAIRIRPAVSVMRPAIFRRRRRIVANSVCRGSIPTRDRCAHVEKQPVGAGVQHQSHLVGERRAAAGAIGRQLGLVLLDEVLGLPPCAVDRFINVLGIAPLQRGDDVADVDASAQHVILVASARLDPGHDPPLFCPTTWPRSASR